VKVTATAISEVLLLEPKVFSDPRGFFFESYNRRSFRDATGLDVDFVQDNKSFSVRNVLRGLHYQVRQAQGKLISVVAGDIFDVAVDLRHSSPTFGKWVSADLSGANHRMIWIPPGFAHGYLVTSEHALIHYKVTDYYAPDYERTVLWNDPALAIGWPLESAPILSAKDAAGVLLAEAELLLEAR
jgi:dTDP-4-dehydrorhamnose 3,5-epimerase